MTKSKRKHFFSGIRPLDARNYDGIVLFRDMKSFIRLEEVEVVEALLEVCD